MAFPFRSHWELNQRICSKGSGATEGVKSWAWIPVLSLAAFFHRILLSPGYNMSIDPSESMSVRSLSARAEMWLILGHPPRIAVGKKYFVWNRSIFTRLDKLLGICSGGKMVLTITMNSRIWTRKQITLFLLLINQASSPPLNPFNHLSKSD